MRKSVLFIFLALYVCAATAARAQRTSTPPRPATTQPAKPQPVTTPKPAASPTPVPIKKVDDCGCEVETPPDVLAVVNGVKISSKEIDDALGDKIQELQQSVSEARKRELNLQINSLLLEAEAKRRGLTTDQGLKAEIIAKISEPTDDEAASFHDQNR